jgi:hypothetical protein
MVRLPQSIHLRDNPWFGLYRCIRDYHWHEWQAAMAFLWSKVYELEAGSFAQSDAIEHLKYLEQQLQADEIIERNKRGVTNG